MNLGVLAVGILVLGTLGIKIAKENRKKEKVPAKKKGKRKIVGINKIKGPFL